MIHAHTSHRRFLLSLLLTLAVCGALMGSILLVRDRARHAISSPAPTSPPSASAAPTDQPEVKTTSAVAPPDPCCSISAPAHRLSSEEVSAIEARFGAQISVSWADPVQGITTVGSLGTVPAWSTSKVPLSVAVVQAGEGDNLASFISDAIRLSDNPSADVLWRSLGDDDTARAQAVTEILRQVGDESTTVPQTQLYPPYSVFGQTQWSTSSQVLFAQRLPCLVGSEQVTTAMRSVDPSQAWGLGSLEAPAFKGGWGPTLDGYTTRQFGWYTGPDGNRVVVSVAAQSDSFATGITVLNAVANALAPTDG